MWRKLTYRRGNEASALEASAVKKLMVVMEGHGQGACYAM